MNANKSAEGLSEFEKQSPLSRALHSIRTRYSLATGFFLLLTLAVFYAGGRVVLVHLVRDTEKQVKDIGADLARIAFRNSERVRKTAQLAVPKDVAWPVDTARIAGLPGYAFAAAFDADGKFAGGHRNANGSTAPFDPAVLAPYEETLREWTASTLRNTGDAAATGILRLRSESLYATMLNCGGRGCVLVGMPFDPGVFSSRMNESLGGLDVRITNRKADVTVRAAVPREIAQARDRGGFGIVPMFSEAANFYTGGFWDLGTTQLEAVYAIRDIAGNAISMVSVSIPKTFSSVTSAAVGRLAFFVAALGLIFVLPIFWFQSKVLLNPLTEMTAKIAELGKHNADIDCPRLEWHGKDEFALLAISVNRMLETISKRSVEVANTEKRHQALIDCIPDTLAIFDPIGRLVAIGKQQEDVEQIAGLVPGELPSDRIFGRDSVEQFLRVLGDTFRDGGVGKMRMTVQLPDGAPKDAPTRHFELRVVRMDEYFALAVVRDVSDEVAEHRLRLAAEERSRDAEKRESLTLLAAGIAHDMNNVLSVVLSAAESADADPSGDSLKCLKTIREAVRRGNSMMKELQTFAGENRISLMRVDPNIAVKDVELLSTRVVGRNIAIDYHCGENLPAVDADPNQFWKVLFNIVKNAGEAIGSRPGHIVIATERLEMTPEKAVGFRSAKPLEAGPGTLFTISDDGPGIPPELLPRLFDPFVSSKAVGRGLGLATVCTIIEAHGGGIAVKSVLDRGTTFLIFLPESKLPETEERTPAEQAGDAELSGEVLVVDDEMLILRTSSILLKALKITPFTARDNQEALAIVRRRSSTLRAIILDADLGGVDTVRLLGMFRTTAPKVPVIVSSGSAEEQIAKLFAAEPYDAFLGKPYTADEIRRTLLAARPRGSFA